MCHFLRIAEAFQRNLRDDVRGERIHHLFGQPQLSVDRRGNRAWADDVHSDSPACEFGGKASCHRTHRRLTRGINAGRGNTGLVHERRVQNDRSVVVQKRDGFLDSKEYPLDVDIECLVVASSETLLTGANLAMPALANSTSIRPSFFVTVSNNASRSPSLLTSDRTASTSAPSSVTASSSDYWLRPEIATLAPAC